MKTYSKKILLGLLTTICFVGVSMADGKKKATLEVTALGKNNQSKNFTAKVASKNSANKFAPTPGVPVSFYLSNGTNQELIGKSVSDESGFAHLELTHKIALDKDGFYTIAAKIENNSLYEDAEETIHLKDGILSVKLNAADTGKLVTASLVETMANGESKPVKDVTVKFFVQRSFGDMPAGEECTATTDDTGLATFNFPKKIPGDTAGSIVVVAKILDNEQFGNLENRTVVKWGVAVPYEKDPFPRALWAPKSPIQIILTLCILFGGVYITYGYVISQLRAIKKEG